MKTVLSAIVLGLLMFGVISQTVIIRNPGCNAYNDQGVCKSCSSRFYKDQNNICQPVNSNCKTYDETTGDCLSCYPGFGLLEGTCLPGIEDEITLDPNCNQFNDSVCIKCSFGYYFDQNNKCIKANPDCATFNQKNGDCTSCYPSFFLAQGKCVHQTVKSIDQNCNQFDGNNLCIKCSSGYYFSNHVCTKIDDSCKNFDVDKKVCQECYPGYALNLDSKCEQQKTKQNPNPLCAEWNSTICVKCAKGSAFGNNNVCLVQDAYCKSYDSQTNECKKCYTGYVLQAGVCKLEGVKNVTDPNCNSFSNGKCTKCSTGYFFDAAKVCVKIDDSCKSFSILNKRCMECYPGYKLTASGECLRTVQSVIDVNCAQFNGSICVKCSVGATFDNTGICVVRDAQCKNFDETIKKCTACYDGYELNINLSTCVLSAIKSVADAYCSEWYGKQCKKCSVGATFNNFGKCVLIDPQCKQYDQSTGQCKNCYVGYALDGSYTCVKTVVQDVKDPLCAEWNQQICTKCSFGAFFNHLGVCSQADSSCKTFDEITGKCSSCYNGYIVSFEGTCVKAADKENYNPQCAEWDTTGDLCLRCASGSFFNGLGLCVLVDPLCKTSDSLNGVCTSCFAGYELTPVGKCEKSQVQQIDPLCSEFKDSKCTKCSFGAFLNKNGVCKLSDSLCSDFNKETGQCTKCYPGHTLIEGKCIIDVSFTISDPFCAEFQNNLCKKCSKGYYFKKDGKCTAVDPLCATFDEMNGQCLSCYVGYQVQSGLCIPKPEEARDPYCAIFNSDNTCKKCSKGYIFSTKLQNCQLTNPLCKTFDESGACTSCYSGYVISGITCELDQNAENSFCAEMVEDICVRCASRTFLNSNGQCEKVSEDCRTYNDFDGFCLSCYSGFALKQGKCVKDSVKGGCSEFSSNGECTKCSTGFYIQNNECAQIDTQCATFNFNSKKCESCYSGYTLLQGRCQISTVNSEFEVKNCVAYNTDKKCIQCFDRFYLTNNQCKEVSLFCKKYDLISGECTGCYSSFKLKNGQCAK